MKKTIFLALIAIFLLSLFACKDEPKDDPKPQSATLTNLFGEGYTTTVMGYLTDTQWNGVPTKIENALNSAYTAGIPPEKGIFRTVFENNNVVITVEKTTEYSTYKVVASNKTNLYVNINGLNDLQSKLTVAITAMEAGEASKE